MPGDNRKGKTRKEEVMKRSTEDKIIAQAMDILSSRLINGEAISSPLDTIQYLTVKLAGREAEVFCVLYLSSQHQAIEFEEVFHGTIDAAAVYPREIVKAVLKHNAAAVIFAHNHPSGVAEPSTADRRITDRLSSALALIDVRVLDHIIIGGTNSYSFAENGLL